MTNFEIRGPIEPGSGPLTRLTAPEFSGRIIDPLKRDFVRAAERTALNMEGIRQDLQVLGWGVDAVANAVDSLGHQIVSGFGIQTQYLSDQLSVLRSIDYSLKNSRRVQAAERIEQAGQLLGFKQYDLAFAYASEAIGHDATNPGGHIAAGWALIGNGRIFESIGYFVDATSVTTDLKDYKLWIDCTRQGARCQLATGDTLWAGKNLDSAISTNLAYIPLQAQHVKKLEAEQSPYLARSKSILASRWSDLATLHYDATIVAAADRNKQAANSHIEAAVRIDERYAKLAVGEPLFEGAGYVSAHALRVAVALKKRRENQRRIQ